MAARAAGKLTARLKHREAAASQSSLLHVQLARVPPSSISRMLPESSWRTECGRKKPWRAAFMSACIASSAALAFARSNVKSLAIDGESTQSIVSAPPDSLAASATTAFRFRSVTRKPPDPLRAGAADDACDHSIASYCCAPPAPPLFVGSAPPAHAIESVENSDEMLETRVTSRGLTPLSMKSKILESSFEAKSHSTSASPTK